MTLAPDAPPTTDHRPKGVEFIVLLSMVMALAALGIDLMLPAFDAIRGDFDLADGSNEVARIITAYFLGMALGPIPYGALADRWGRRPVLWLGGSIYVCGAVLSALAPTFSLMLVGRFIWGLGAAGGRVVVFAVLRDTQSGQQMARLMSYITAVFILVPVVAPSLGAVILQFGSWPAVYLTAAAAGVAVLAWSTRLSETLAPEDRRSNMFAAIPDTAWRIARTPELLGPLLALTAIQTVLTTYLASSELIVGEIFDRRSQFPVIFGAVAAVFGLAAMVNGRLLGRFTMRTILRHGARIYLVGAGLVLGLAIAAGGVPPFWIFMPLLSLTLSTQLFLMPNLNTLILAPMANAAGTASALITTFSTALAALLGAVVDAQFDDTVTPLAVAMIVAAAVVVVLVTITLRPEPADPL